MHASLAQQDVDYEVSFVDCQRLERALEKLSLSQETLIAIERLACTLRRVREWDESTGSDDFESTASNRKCFYTSITSKDSGELLQLSKAVR